LRKKKGGDFSPPENVRRARLTRKSRITDISNRGAATRDQLPATKKRLVAGMAAVGERGDEL
jgi:hypothetical protein